MPKPPPLAPVNAEEQQLYFKIPVDVRATYPISKGEPSHPWEESNFSHLYPDLGHYPKLMTIKNI